MIQWKYYKANYQVQKYISCDSTSGRYIHRIYCIEPNIHISPSILSSFVSFTSVPLQEVPSSSSSPLLPSFDDLTKLLHCHNGRCCCSSWGSSSLTTEHDGIFYPHPLPQLFRSYFAVTNLWVSCSLSYIHFWKLFSGVFSKFLSNFFSD